MIAGRARPRNRLTQAFARCCPSRQRPRRCPRLSRAAGSGEGRALRQKPKASNRTFKANQKEQRELSGWRRHRLRTTQSVPKCPQCLCSSHHPPCARRECNAVSSLRLCSQRALLPGRHIVQSQALRTSTRLSWRHPVRSAVCAVAYRRLLGIRDSNRGAIRHRLIRMRNDRHNRHASGECEGQGED